MTEKKPVKKKQDGLFSKLIVRQLIALNSFFTLLFLVAHVMTGGQEASVLEQEWFSFVRYEVLALAGIRVTKEATAAVTTIAELRYNKKKEEDNNLYG